MILVKKVIITEVVSLITVIVNKVIMKEEVFTVYNVMLNVNLV